MRPWEIARLTDHQVLHNYILPQAERDERSRRASKGEPPLPSADDEAEQSAEPESEQPNRQMMIGVMMGMLGMSKEAAIREYDEQLRMNAEAKRKGI